MKKTIQIIFTLALFLNATAIFAQSAAVKKAVNATFTLTTFKADGSILATSNGAFISNNGVGVTTWKPFVGADRAVIIDNKGQKYEVEAILGANEIYDIAKLKINTATSSLPFATTITPDSPSWIITPAKTNAPIQATTSKVEKFMNQYNYCVLSSSATEKQVGAAVVNNKGQLIGIYNIAGTLQSSTDAAYSKEFKLTGLSQNDLTLRQTNIRIGLPDNIDEALIALMLSNDKTEKIHQETINEFITKFPKDNNGYNALANAYIAKGDLAAADKTLKEAISKVDKKDMAYYNYARTIYLSSLNPSLNDKAKALDWSLDKAMSIAEQAYNTKPENIYKHLQAQIVYSKGEYQKAYDSFEALTKTDMKNPELYLEMAQSLQQLNRSDEEILEKLNQSIALCDTPYVQTSAPYFLARAQQLDKMGQYRKAMQDYYTYEYFNLGRLDANFYYMREQCEVKGKLWQQALQDILIASRLAPNEPMYCAEAGSLLLRVNKFDEAMTAATQAIILKPDYAEAYLILGIAQCQSNRKTEGIKSITKAKELGNTQADSFLEKFK